MEAARLPGTLLGELLVRRGELSEDQLAAVLLEQEQSEARLGELLLAQRIVSASAIARALAEQYGLEFVDLEQEPIDPDAASLLPERVARRYGALPVRFLAEELVLVAVRDPTDILTADDLHIALGMPRRLGVAAADALDAAIARHFGIDALSGPAPEEAEEETDEADVIDIREAGNSAPAIQLVHSLITQAIDGTPCELVFAWSLGANASFTFTAHAVYLPRPRIEIPGPQGIQATFDWQAAKAVSPARMCTAVLVNTVVSY